MSNAQNGITFEQFFFWPLCRRLFGLVINQGRKGSICTILCHLWTSTPTSKTYRLTVMNFMSINNLKSWQSNKITDRDQITDRDAYTSPHCL